MKRIIFVLLVLFPILAMAQRTQRLLPQSNPSGKSWVDMQDSSSTTFTFTFPGAGLTGSGQENSYSGYLEVIAWVDTVSTATDSASTGDRDSLTVSIYPLFYDLIDARLERSNDTDRDSIDVKNVYNWGTNHSDARVSFNVSCNLPPCDGFQVNAYTGANGAQCKIRVEARIAESEAF